MGVKLNMKTNLMKHDIVIVSAFENKEIIESVINNIIKLQDFKNIILIGNERHLEFIKRFEIEIKFIDENKLIKDLNFDSVKKNISKIDLEAVKRSGWYFQQFLKMAYSLICEDEYYIVWDSDTMPIKKIDLIIKNKPIFYYKNENNKPYFETMKRLFPKLKFFFKKSFICEIMIINREIMLELIKKISLNNNINLFWINILLSVKRDDLKYSGFSEFETYGTYVLNYYNEIYSKKKIFSYRRGKALLNNSLLEINKIPKKYQTISFEKWDVNYFTQQKSIGRSFLKLPFKIRFYLIKLKIDKILNFLTKGK